ncbi:hypothetical protein BDR26DRAFT_861350 [Obelidium mucronatum]|nr:hypothetical protein BDR26DRAFT_861350 [Obelidium mucronatum]
MPPLALPPPNKASTPLRRPTLEPTLREQNHPKIEIPAGKEAIDFSDLKPVQIITSAISSIPLAIQTTAPAVSNNADTLPPGADIDAVIRQIGGQHKHIDGATPLDLWGILEFILILHVFPVIYCLVMLYRNRRSKDQEILKKTDYKSIRELKRLMKT